MTKTIYDIINANVVLEKLLKQQHEYNIQTAYKIYKLKKELDEVENFTMDRLKLALGNDYDLDNLDENQKMLYTSIMLTQININDTDLKLNDLTDNDRLKITVNEVEKIVNLLS